MNEIIELNGKRYKEIKDSTIKKIVVLDRGWVVVGDVTIEGGNVIVDNCQNIRRWGTSRGLGQLAENGPTAETKLDPQPRTETNVLCVIQMIDCSEAWNENAN